MKYTVIKNEDVTRGMSYQLENILSEINYNRKTTNKSTNSKYFVINIDEPYADEIREIIKKYHGECEV